VLHFYLAGINNQNFLMRDKETGTWWQQITGKAISGPMKGASLDLVLSDELSFGDWKSEVSGGKVLASVPKYEKEYDPKWEAEVAKLPVVISFPGTELKSRDVVVGLEIAGPGRAYPWDRLVKQSPIMDRVNDTPVLVAVGPDRKSFRVFVSRVDGKDTEFFLKAEAEVDPTAKAAAPADTKTAAPANASAATSSSADAKADVDVAAAVTTANAKNWILIDTATASEWNFQGCAVSGPSQGKCLDRIPSLKDYWFDWRNYHPETTVYKR
jgi:ribosomal protein L12E/L44/L45/RPP1/RPP2